LPLGPENMQRHKPWQKQMQLFVKVVSRVTTRLTEYILHSEFDHSNWWITGVSHVKFVRR
jgi:hypothetical protein